MIEVVLSNGDRAEAETPESAQLAAKTLMDDAAGASAYARLGLTATFFADARLVREGVTRTELG